MIRIRESFGAKLLAALLSTVGLLLTVTLGVVRFETRRQVDAVTERTIRSAGTLFEELNELQRQQAALLARPFTEGRRALAMLDAAIEAGDVDYLARQVEYEMLVAKLDDVLLVFTDDGGRPFLSIVRGERIVEGDPADIAPIAGALLQGDELETSAYRVVDGRMYNVRSLYIELGSRPIGTITFGLPIQPQDVERIGSVGGFEACFYVEGACVVGTPDVGERLGSALAVAVSTQEPIRTEAGGQRLLIRSEPLTPARPEQGMRIVAVPLDEVLGPFDSIQRALLFGGAAALLLAALLGTALSRSLTRPITGLVAAAGRVAEGDYEAEVNVDSHDEMGTLADAFNHMTRGLLLRERYRAVLHKVVSQDVAEELMKGDVELGGENREVSVLFADIGGFTPLTEGMEPQQVISLLNDCMEHLAHAVDVEGGVVDKFIGDEIMAVFGAPARQADHAQRAICAAQRMRDGMDEMNEARAARGEAPLGISIGVNSGVAVAGNMGSHDRLNYTVLGETVNLAARLTHQAEAGEILISGHTHEMASEGIVAACLGRRSLKGFSSDVEVFSVECVEVPTADPTAMRESARPGAATPAATGSMSD